MKDSLLFRWSYKPANLESDPNVLGQAILQCIASSLQNKMFFSKCNEYIIQSINQPTNLSKTRSLFFSCPNICNKY